jgi:cytoskeleton protein RodZ
MSDLGALSPENSAIMPQDIQQDGSRLHEASAGTLLRQAREAAGLHIAALAVALKVPVKKLEALEADRLDLLPDAVFVRALAASVCRTLKIDAAQVLAQLPQTGKPNLGQQHAPINTPFRSPGDGPGPSLITQVSRPAVLAGLLLVLAALVLIFMPAAQRQESTPGTKAGAAGNETTPSSQAAAGASAGEAMARTELLMGEKPIDTARPAEVPEPAVAAPPAPALTPQPQVAAKQVEPVPVPAATLPAVVEPPPLAPKGIIVFKARGESWVEVTDAKGVVVVRRTLAAGEEVGATGALPLAAVVGRVDATQVQVRGKVFDLNPVSRDNVARFEVK